MQSNNPPESYELLSVMRSNNPPESPLRRFLKWGFGPWRRKCLNYVLFPAAIIAIVLSIVSIIVILVFMIQFILAGKASPDPNSLDFSLFKNTRFQSCSTGGPTNANCSLIYDDTMLPFRDMKSKEASWYRAMVYRQYPQGTDWCGLVRCVSDFKVIPSTPRPSAFEYTPFFAWVNINLAILSALYMMFKIERVPTFGFRSVIVCGIKLPWVKLHKEYSHPPTDCEGPSSLDWGFYAYDTVSFGLWWYSVYLTLAKPTWAAPMSMLGWLTGWRYFCAIDHHPISCRFQSSTVRNWLKSLICVITIAQWALTWYAFGIGYPSLLGGRSTSVRRYDCQASQIALAPGTSTCSAETLCSKDWLLDDPGFMRNADFTGAVTYATLFCMVVPIICLVFAAFFKCAKASKTGDVSYLGLVTEVIGLIAGALLLLVMGVGLKATSGANREGTVVFDLDCHALHIAVSPWKQFLDVDNGDRALRIARSWFNA